jgi:ribA/ribD-fused uncharacterized protein
MTNQDKQQLLELKTSRKTKLFHFYWQSGSPFSQCHSCRYTLDGFEYCNAEQGMMHGKALLFQDDQAAQAILRTTSHQKIKALGRSVRGFHEKTWKKYRYGIVYRNNLAKFGQNPDILRKLLKTTGMLVEASPDDPIWGIGLEEKIAKKIPVSKWPGLNLLGLVLTQVRDELLELDDDY